ncbi:DUF4328 domain-containing protein [Gordonia sihwensis]|uniref:DUF4328 domain-containing protein n=1 Tax=Gordonia sihwensis NBRC 108236 TaxID=1223544 RepID=L7LNF7_9ACTN|nr:DUF4328 domain-containing protein [Gordonia sihwensis]MBY4570459.1 DUF4328 domain-containing protein [Gordonia sihwensis]GAC62665.1 hypothetical protein GSI01S_40_00050 [Gordonia sihwensis NBRC 108236]
MLDVCPSCRIQAPHREGRELCPRCGRRLMVLDAQGRVVQRPQSGAARGASAPRTSVARAGLRWVADRPAEARPAPVTVRAHEWTPTPSYRYIPRWGLSDRGPISPGENPEPADPGDVLLRALRMATSMLGAAAVVHLIRYVIAAVNRSTPIPMWLDLLSGAAVLVFGVFAFVAMLVALVAFVRWLLPARAAAYRAADRRDPRPARVVLALAAVPLANVVGVPLLLSEAALCGDAPAPAIGRIKHLGTAWAIVNLVALIAVCYRIGSWFSDSVQVSANALALVTFSLAVSAVFAHWVGPRLVTVLTGPVGSSASGRRLVAA